MIALSARAEPRDIEAGRDAGFTDYVAKFEREALIASLRAMPGRTDRGVTLDRSQQENDRPWPPTCWNVPTQRPTRKSTSSSR